MPQAYNSALALHCFLKMRSSRLYTTYRQVLQPLVVRVHVLRCRRVSIAIASCTRSRDFVDQIGTSSQAGIRHFDQGKGSKEYLVFRDERVVGGGIATRFSSPDPLCYYIRKISRSKLNLFHSVHELGTFTAELSSPAMLFAITCSLLS